jgi:hypothetical protein
VQVYALDRTGPSRRIERAPRDLLERIAGRVRANGVPAKVF